MLCTGPPYLWWMLHDVFQSRKGSMLSFAPLWFQYDKKVAPSAKTSTAFVCTIIRETSGAANPGVPEGDLSSIGLFIDAHIP